MIQYIFLLAPVFVIFFVTTALRDDNVDIADMMVFTTISMIPIAREIVACLALLKIFGVSTDTVVFKHKDGE